MRKDDLDGAHWTQEGHRQRLTIKQWRELLLNKDDAVIFKGRVRRLKAKPLGAGVVEIYKEPLKEDDHATD